MGKGSKKKAIAKAIAEGHPLPPPTKRVKVSKPKPKARPLPPPPLLQPPPLPPSRSFSTSSSHTTDSELLELYRAKLLTLAKAHAALLKKVEVEAGGGGVEVNDLISFSQLSESSPPSSPAPSSKPLQDPPDQLFTHPDESFVSEMDQWLQVHDANARLSLTSSLEDTPMFSQTSAAAPPDPPGPPPPSLPLTHNVRVGVGVLIRKKSTKKVHAGIRKGSHGAGTLALPGGHLEFGESWEECAIREVEEECGIDISKCRLRLIHVTNDPMPSENKHYITLFMGCVVNDDAKFVNAEPHKCEGWDQYTFKELSDSGKLFGPLHRIVDQKPNFFTDFLEGGNEW